MKKVAVIVSPGFEEIEVITPIDILRRAGLEVTTFGLEDKVVKGGHGIAINCDNELKKISNNYDALILPGGMPGAKNIRRNKFACSVITKFFSSNLIVGAICASPGVILGGLGLLKGKKFTCFPGFQDGVDGHFMEDRVVVDNNLVTSRGPGTAMEFSYKLVEILVSKDVSVKLQKSMLFSR